MSWSVTLSPPAGVHQVSIQLDLETVFQFSHLVLSFKVNSQLVCLCVSVCVCVFTLCDQYTVISVLIMITLNEYIYMINLV